MAYGARETDPKYNERFSFHAFASIALYADVEIHCSFTIHTSVNRPERMTEQCTRKQ